jgi:hypothetical protein
MVRQLRKFNKSRKIKTINVLIIFWQIENSLLAAATAITTSKTFSTVF